MSVFNFRKLDLKTVHNLDFASIVQNGEQEVMILFKKKMTLSFNSCGSVCPGRSSGGAVYEAGGWHIVSSAVTSSC